MSSAECFSINLIMFNYLLFTSILSNHICIYSVKLKHSMCETQKNLNKNVKRRGRWAKRFRFRNRLITRGIGGYTISLILLCVLCDISL